MPAVYPPRIVPASHRGQYPHMAKHDATVWDKFLAARSGEFLGFAYDVALGGVKLTAPDMSPADILGWQYNTALKIDAVGLRPEGVWIIEVKPDATVSALGAAVAYTLVAERDRVFEGVLNPVIVCAACQRDVKWAAVQLGVLVIEMGA